MVSPFPHKNPIDKWPQRPVSGPETILLKTIKGFPMCTAGSIFRLSYGTFPRVGCKREAEGWISRAQLRSGSCQAAEKLRPLWPLGPNTKLMRESCDTDLPTGDYHVPYLHEPAHQGHKRYIYMYINLSPSPEGPEHKLDSKSKLNLLSNRTDRSWTTSTAIQDRMCSASWRHRQDKVVLRRKRKGTQSANLPLLVPRPPRLPRPVPPLPLAAVLGGLAPEAAEPPLMRRFLPEPTLAPSVSSWASFCNQSDNSGLAIMFQSDNLRLNLRGLGGAGEVVD